MGMSRAGWQLSGVGWWIAAFLILLSHQLREPVASVFVIEPPHQSAGEPSAVWEVPLTRWGLTDSTGLWSRWSAAAAAAMVIALFAGTIARTQSPRLAAVLVLGAGLTVRSEQVVMLLLAGLAARLGVQAVAPRSSWQWIVKVLLIWTAAVIGTIDFGIIVALPLSAPLAGILYAPIYRRRPNALLIAFTTVTICGMALASVIVPGFGDALLRPFTAVWAGRLEPQHSSLSCPLMEPADWPGIVCFGILLVAVLRRLPPAGEMASCAAGVLSLTAILGLTTEYWLSAALFSTAGIATIPVGTRPGQAPRRQRLLAQGSVIAAGTLLFAVQLRELGPINWAAGIPDRMVDLSSWNVTGHALLIDVDQADDWKGTAAPPGIQLLNDGRWECDTAHHLEAAAVSRDVLDGRKERYLRRDGSWGGYGPWFSEHDPLLIAVPSHAYRAIRHLSLDPAWNTLSIDARRVVFGKAKEPQLQMQAQRAANLWFYLEWPNPGVGISTEATLEPGTNADRRAIAAVLNAMRLPYAALRMLPDDDHLDTREMRAWAYTELALRSVRQTGRRSVIDQYRAFTLLRTIAGSPWLTAGQALRIQTCLASLEDTTSDALPVSGSQPGSDEPITAAEQRVRNLLLAGNRHAAWEESSKIENSAVRDWYRAIAQLADDPEGTTTDHMFIFSDREEIPLRLREELYFSLGCLALERPDGAGAAEMFAKSRDQRDPSEYSELRNLYLSRLLVAD